MRKQIATQQKDFSEYINVPLVIGDVQAYEIVHDTPYDLSGVTFKVTAIRADGELIYDVGDTNGTTATYTLKNNMYNVVGITKFRLTLISDDGTVLTSKELIFNAIKENGEAIIDGDDRVPALDTLIINITKATIMCENAQLEYDEQSTKIGVKHKNETEFTYTDFLKGEKGDTGSQGIQGIQGERGLQGDKGDTGLIATYAHYSVTDLITGVSSELKVQPLAPSRALSRYAVLLDNQDISGKLSITEAFTTVPITFESDRVSIAFYDERNYTQPSAQPTVITKLVKTESNVFFELGALVVQNEEDI